MRNNEAKEAIGLVNFFGSGFFALRRQAKKKSFSEFRRVRIEQAPEIVAIEKKPVARQLMPTGMIKAARRRLMQTQH